MFGGNYDEGEKTMFKPIAMGEYVCILDNATIESSKSKGTPLIKLVFKIDDTSSEFYKRTIFHSLWFTEGAYNMTAKQLDNALVFKTLGEHPSIEGFMSAAADKLFALVGKKFTVKVTGHDTFNDKTYEKTWLESYIDTPNAAVQSVGAATAKAPATTSDEIPF